VKAEIVAIGTELLLGDVVNDNAAWLGRELAAIGIDIDRTSVVGDNVARIEAEVAAAAGRADVVITTGGLGPTQDDLTREALALLVGVPLVRDPELEAALRARYAEYGRPDFTANNLRMAEYPQGAGVLRNPAGTAPGLRIATKRATIYALPGVPREMRELFSQHLRDELVRRAGQGAVVLSRALLTVGVWESDVADRLAELDAAANPTIAYLASEGQTTIRITAKAASLAAATEMVDAVDQRVRAALGDVVYGIDADTLSSVTQRLLLAADATVATAESLTGGLLGAALSEVAGSSSTYRGGVVAYATEAKSSIVGVPRALLARRGAVDPDVAAAMATGVRERFGATYGLATTGVAGPTEQDGKPVGLVYVGLAGPGLDSPAHVRELRVSGDRARVRRVTVRVALDLLRRELAGLPLAPSTRD
jgi:nicotinamide-nucleotide amidase